MIVPYKERQVSTNDNVQVYRNLNNNLFSIRCDRTQLVLAHGEGFIVKNARPYISESGRQRVIREQCKNVHAYLIGAIDLEARKEDYKIFDEIYYNPYTQDSFTLRLQKRELGECDVLFKDGRAYALSKK